MPDPVDPRTGAPLVRAQTITADLGHPACPKCGGKQNHPAGDHAPEGNVRCANCGNIFEAPKATKK